jgi:hypothetical protein
MSRRSPTLAAACGLALALAPAAHAAAPSGGRSGTVAAAHVLVRSGPGTGYASTGRLNRGTPVFIACQAPGTRMNGPRASNWPWWNRITKPVVGWVSDAFVDSGPATRAARDCRPDELPGGAPKPAPAPKPPAPAPKPQGRPAPVTCAPLRQGQSLGTPLGYDYRWERIDKGQVPAIPILSGGRRVVAGRFSVRAATCRDGRRWRLVDPVEVRVTSTGVNGRSLKGRGLQRGMSLSLRAAAWERAFDPLRLTLQVSKCHDANAFWRRLNTVASLPLKTSYALSVGQFAANQVAGALLRTRLTCRQVSRYRVAVGPDGGGTLRLTVLSRDEMQPRTEDRLVPRCRTLSDVQRWEAFGPFPIGFDAGKGRETAPATSGC